MKRIIQKAIPLVYGLNVSTAILIFSVSCFISTASAQRKYVLSLPVPSVSVFARVPRYGEGLVFDKEGRLYVSDPFGNAVLQISGNGEPRVWARVSLPNGHKILPDGTHVVMEGGGSGVAGVVWLDREGVVLRRLKTDERGRGFRFPNDLTIEPQTGGFYFTDPGAFRQKEPGRIFYVDAKGKITTISDGEIDFPNGIVLRPGGKSLLVAESLLNRVLEFTVEKPGKLGRKSVFAELPSQPNPLTGGEAEPDGMALDLNGNLYVAHFGAAAVRVFDPQGKFLGSYGTGGAATSNLVFSSSGAPNLYVYAAEGDSFAEINERGGKILRLTSEMKKGDFE